MAYDAEGRHSTYEFAESDVGRLVNQGVPAAKICLGIPLYGRGVNDRSRELGYSQIMARFKPGAEVDEMDGLYFNGISTVERKTRLALSTKLAGVMAWEIGQDADGDSSLLRAIHRVALKSQAQN
jgi:GH18 family chitinase